MKFAACVGNVVGSRALTSTRFAGGTNGACEDGAKGAGYAKPGSSVRMFRSCVRMFNGPSLVSSAKSRTKLGSAIILRARSAVLKMNPNFMSVSAEVTTELLSEMEAESNEHGSHDHVNLGGDATKQ